MQQESVESLQHQILEQQKLLEQHEFMFQQLVHPSQRPTIHVPSIPTVRPKQPESASPPRSLDLPSLLPMMGSLFNVLTPVMTSSVIPSREEEEDEDMTTTHYINSTVTKDIHTEDDLLNVEDELALELQELKQSEEVSSEEEEE